MEWKPHAKVHGQSLPKVEKDRLAIQFAMGAWLGLVPRQNSTGGKARLGGISKRGDSHLRRLLVNSAHKVLLCSKAAKTDPRLISLLHRKPRLVAPVALVTKTARVAWAIVSRRETLPTRSSGSITC